MREEDIVAILCSDIHLSHKPPTARSAEPDWYAAMARPLREIRNLAKEYETQIICAGDIFDRWNSPPELINFALKEMPGMISIPGQHDLPNHSLEEIHRSAYWTLVKARKLLHIDIEVTVADHPKARPTLCLHPFPWGEEVKPLTEKTRSDVIHIAVIHEYCWIEDHCYPGAPDEQNLGKRTKQLKGYSASVWGDNHKGFVRGDVCNCGTLMRRTIDEIDYRPFVGLLRADRTIDRHYLDISEDKFLEPEKVIESEMSDLSEFIEELKTLGPDSLDFRTAVEQYIEREATSDGVKAEVISIIEEQQNASLRT